jgi:hypothetical protein
MTNKEAIKIIMGKNKKKRNIKRLNELLIHSP